MRKTEHFEALTGHTNGNDLQAVEYTCLEFRKKVWAEVLYLSSVYKWFLDSWERAKAFRKNVLC